MQANNACCASSERSQFYLVKNNDNCNFVFEIPQSSAQRPLQTEMCACSRAFGAELRPALVSPLSLSAKAGWSEHPPTPSCQICDWGQSYYNDWEKEPLQHKSTIGKDLKGHSGANQVSHLSSLKRFCSVLSVLLPNGCTVSGGMKGAEIPRGQRSDAGNSRTLCCRLLFAGGYPRLLVVCCF